jgi:integrase
VQHVGADKPVKDVGKADFVLWVEHELTRGVMASSVQRRLNNIRAALNDSKEFYEELTTFTVPKYSLGPEATLGRYRILDETEIKAIGQVLKSDKQWRDAHDFFRVALGSGGRFDELVPVVLRKDMTTAGIKWTDVNASAGTIRLFSGKTGKARTIYVPIVVDLLLERKRAGLGTKVHAFNRRDHWIRKVFRQASRLCGIPYGQRIPGGWTVHDLRHTCLTHLLQNGVDLAAVRDFAGHSSITETSKYVHSSEKSKNRLAEASGSLMNFA